MNGDEDLAGLLPEPPPPRPAAREAALAAAMRRFDSIADMPAPVKPVSGHRPAWSLAGRGQIGIFASILLVALIGVPIALLTPPRPAPVPAPETSAPRAPAGRPTPAGPSVAVRPAPHVQPPTVPPPPVVATDQIAPATGSGTQSFAGPGAETAPPPPPPAAPPPPPPAPAPAAKAEGRVDATGQSRDSAIVVTAQRRAEARMQDAPVAVTTITTEELNRGGEDVVVTGTRRSRASVAAARRGDWNACTVNDPEQSLRGCKRLVDPGAKGPPGAAAARLADGLLRAWEDDWDGAIAAFDQAIALQPRLGFAWLNRGLAWQHQGDLDRALADLNRAIGYDQSARGYYSRSLVLRAQGKKRRADADLAHAVDLDSRYDALVE